MTAVTQESAPVTFVNAALADEDRATLRMQAGRITDINLAPQRGDRIVDLGGDRLLPGLINAHDHLQFNNSPHLDYPAPYGNASEWISDVNARTEVNAALRASVVASRSSRFLSGGLKNLLSGVTTVAHHDPCDPQLLQPGFPVRVVAAYGWAHSLYIDGEQRVRESYARTPGSQPWIIHAAEGIDEVAACEFARLQELGCIGSNTLLVHGLAMDDAQRHELVAAGGALVWCPSSNLRLFGRTAQVTDLLAQGRLALGSDSRLTAAGDLLDELRVAQQQFGLDEKTLERIVTRDSARLLRLPQAGVLQPGAVADLLVVPAAMGLSRLRRRDVRLVVLAGSARYGDSDYAARLAPAAEWTAVQVDGRVKSLQRRLAGQLLDAGVKEPGVELMGDMERALCG